MQYWILLDRSELGLLNLVEFNSRFEIAQSQKNRISSSASIYAKCASSRTQSYETKPQTRRWCLIFPRPETTSEAILRSPFLAGRWPSLPTCQQLCQRCVVWRDHWRTISQKQGRIILFHIHSRSSANIAGRACRIYLRPTPVRQTRWE